MSAPHSPKFTRALLVTSTILCSWLGMMIVHEAGHAAIALLTGGRVQRIVLPVLGFSRTDVFPNPHPLAVTWAGPVLGELFPLVAWQVARATRLSWSYLLRFFAGFCFIANGAYIGAASFDQVGDAYPMLLFGSRPWQLWLFGIVSISLGLFLWHNLGPRFGLGPRAREVRPQHALAVSITLALIVAAELILPLTTKSHM
jgi:peptidase M50B-like protein